MDSSGFSMGGGPPSRRELHGPRPTPLKVRNDSYKIKKTPAVPLPPAQQQQQQIRRPIIIYTVSPKVIHTTPGNFMSVVQSLTGSSSSAATATAPAPAPSSSALPARAAFSAGEVFSPAARWAAIERGAAQAAKTPVKSEQILSISDDALLGIDFEYGVVAAEAVTTKTMFPGAGILSPMPSALPSIPPSLFTPPSAAARNQINYWFNELGPSSLGVDRYSGVNSLFTASPNNNFFLSSGIAASPAAGSCWDLFNQFQDF